MPNIKIDVDALTKAIRDEGAASVERIENTVKSCITELQQVASVAQALPPSALDLVATAELCLVSELDTRDFHRPHRLSVDIDLGNSRIDLGNSRLSMTSHDYDRRPIITDGRYRALFFLVPIGDKK